MEWSFHYEGPRDPGDDRDCALCNAVARKACLTHGSTPTVGCGHCDAVRSGICSSHCGLAIALAMHDEVLPATDPANASWGRAPTAPGDRGRRQQRVETPMTDEKKERIEAAEKQFAVVKSLVMAETALLPDGSMIDVSVRGDENLNGSALRNLIIEIRSF